MKGAMQQLPLPRQIGATYHRIDTMGWRKGCCYGKRSERCDHQGSWSDLHGTQDVFNASLLEMQLSDEWLRRSAKGCT